MRLSLIIALSLSFLFLGCNDENKTKKELEFGKEIRSIAIDHNNNVWFVTELGLENLSGNSRNIFQITNIPETSINLISIKREQSLSILYITTDMGVLEIDLDNQLLGKITLVDTISAPNLLSNNISHFDTDSSGLKWYGTIKGVNANQNGKWLTNNYSNRYNQKYWENNTIQCLTFSNQTGYCYVGTSLSGVARFKIKTDAVTGASEYSAWGPILMPSDNVKSVFVDLDGNQWIGTDNGIAFHDGKSSTEEGWGDVIDTSSTPLLGNMVLAICQTPDKTMWFGTTNGLSAMKSDSTWLKFTTNEGMTSNQVLSLAVDINGKVWAGTDNGLNMINGTNIIRYH